MTKKDKKVAIKVSNLSKDFKLPHEQQNSLKGKLINFNKRGYELQHVLKDISFDIEEGDFFGIVGRNGSGKSTLLKILSGIYTPTKGNVEVNGKLVPFIELGVGFNPELSGRDNVFLNGALLGFGRDEMEVMYDDIVEFAELEKFMDQKLKNYSSGMQVRLAFSIAIRADADILLLDEVLAVGDEAFQRKCNDYFYDLKKRKKTVILVTHGMDNVRKFCNKAMMIRDGEVVVYGSPEDVANEYSIENLESKPDNQEQSAQKSKENRYIEGLNVSVSKDSVTQDDELEITVRYKSLVDYPTRIRLVLHDIDRGVPIFATSTKLIEDRQVNKTLLVKMNTINSSKLRVQMSIRNKDDDTLHFLPDSKAPNVLLHRTDYPNPKKPQTYAVLFDRGEWR